MDSIEQQVNYLFIPALEALKEQGKKLRKLVKLQYPPVPAPRAPKRFVTKRLGVSWTADKEETIVFLAYRNNYWHDTEEALFLQKLFKQTPTPRLSLRALSRLDQFTRWLQAREDGILKASRQILKSQEPWVEKLNARIACAELGEGYKQSPKTDAIRRAFLQKDKIQATTLVRECAKLKTSEAIPLVEAAFKELEKNGKTFLRVENQLIEITF